MIDKERLQQLLPAACEWVKTQSEFLLARGVALTERQADDARRAGVKNCSRVRVLVVDRIPLPENPELAEAARRTQIISEKSRAIALGYGIMIRADRWGGRELLVHNLVHVAQYERCRDLEEWVRKYLGDRQDCAKFTAGELEKEASDIARQVCARND